MLYKFLACAIVGFVIFFVLVRIDHQAVNDTLVIFSEFFRILTLWFS